MSDEVRKHQYNKYLYDESTGMVFPDQLICDARFVEKWKSQGILKQHKLGKFIPVGNEEFKVSRELIKRHLFDEGNGFKHLILSVTDDCNLRCKYCIFSDNYPLTRNYSKLYMDFGIAKKAVDYYFKCFKLIQRKNPLRKPVIGFYGGEPLLNFDLIKKIVNYIGKEYHQFDTFYNITTNGTLLNLYKADFLIRNNFAIAISLDGPEKEHDRNRIFQNGKPTFQVILKNIKEIKKEYPEFRYMSIISTYDYGSDMLKINEFFEENSELLPLIGRVDMVMPSFTGYYDQFTENDVKRHHYQMIKLNKIYLDRISHNKKVGNYLRALIEGKYFNYLIRPIGPFTRPSLMPWTGTCIPGEKIAVRPDGKFHICERINEYFPIGDVNSGLDLGKIERILINYKENITADCKGCPIQRLCGLCFAQCAGEGIFKKDPYNICNLMEKEKKEMIGELYSLLEKNPSLYSEMSTGYYKKIAEVSGWMEGL